MALFQSTVTYRDRKAFADTLLLNTKKVDSIRAYSTVSEFYYVEKDNRTRLYRTALTKDELTTLISGATEFSNLVELPMLGKSTVKTAKLNALDLFASSTVYNVNMDNLVKGWNIGSTATCYLLFRIGKKNILYKVDDNIADVEGASSTSVSIA